MNPDTAHPVDPASRRPQITGPAVPASRRPEITDPTVSRSRPETPTRPYPTATARSRCVLQVRPAGSRTTQAATPRYAPGCHRVSTGRSPVPLLCPRPGRQDHPRLAGPWWILRGRRPNRPPPTSHPLVVNPPPNRPATHDPIPPKPPPPRIPRPARPPSPRPGCSQPVPPTPPSRNPHLSSPGLLP